MLRHYLAIALRNVARTRLYAAISVIGLAAGFAAATLIGLYVHDELTYDRWLPNHERIYQVSAAGGNANLTGVAPSDLGNWLASDYPQLEAVTRLFPDPAFLVDAENPDHKFNETIYWADRSTPEVFDFPALVGTFEGALDRPDALVVTRAVAEKYFGTAQAAVGKTLLYKGEQPLTVTAVLRDLPSSTSLGFNGFAFNILAAAHAPFSPAAEQERAPLTVFGGKLWNSFTYVLVKRGEPIAPLRDSIATLIDRHAPTPGERKASERWPLGVRPLAALHLSSGLATAPEREKYGAVYTVAAIGLLILLVASINFVNLLTAVGVRRALEVGVRKALGAQRGDLFTQFMSESFLYVGLGAVAGAVLAAALLRPLNTFLRRTIDFSMFLDWRIAAASIAFLVAVGLLAGVYPAVVLSSFRPATVTKGGRAGGGGQAMVRQALVVLQFSFLIALLIATTVTYRQMRLGVSEGLRFTTDPVVVLQGGCNDTLKDAMLREPSVRAAACSMLIPQWGWGMASQMQRAGRPGEGVHNLPVDFGYFELYGVELAAGRLFSKDLGTDAAPADNAWRTPEAVVLNETAVRALGFGSAQEAVGQTVQFRHLFRLPATFTPQHDATIIGVLRDFQIGQVRDAIPPAAFYVDSGNFRVLSVKLDGRATPEALAAIDRIWNEYAGPAPAQRTFYDDSIQAMYVDLSRQTTLFTIFAGIAVLIAVLGLVGLAAHAAVSRTKEIGIRKTLGGGRWQIVRLLLWQFSRPVLLANVIAWPAAFWAMSVWLGGFARRVELDWWMFAGAGAV
ncbi:MAG TPA: ABC transporter permease, partial [Gammaproteobacteria bacterium]|nr:ABC transporter permease [Gammaproteobacteria bacterium]